MQKLEEEFLASGGKWKEFLIEDLFEKLDLKFKKKKFNKAEDISQKRTKEFDLPLVNAKNGDNGIMYYGRSTDFESAEMTIDIVNDGAVSTGNVYPQPQRTGVLYNAYLIKAKQNVSKVSLSFLSTAIQKSIKLKFGYENKAGWEKVKKEYISLPSLDDNPAYFYMDSFITELQAERLQELQVEWLQELQGYLQVTGLSNYTLTEEEQRVIDDLDNIKWGTFNIEKLFGKATRGKRLKSADRISGDLPFVTAGENDTGISAFIGNDVEPFKANTITIDMFGSAKYRNYQYGADDHIAVVHCDKLAKESVLFLTSAIHKVSNAGQFSYSKNFYAKDADELNISLPIKNSKPNYEQMEIIGSAVQKLVIADVVKYADRELSAYKSVIA